MNTLSLDNSQSNQTRLNMTVSLTSIEQSGSELPDRIICSSLPSTISTTLSSTISLPIQTEAFSDKTSQNEHAASLNLMCLSVCSKTKASVPQKPVASDMLVINVEAGTKKRIVESTNWSSAEKIANNKMWKWPKQSRGYLWTRNKVSLTPSTTAIETASLLLCISNSELNSPVPNKMIKDHPDLFRIVPPINVDCFQHLLETYLNRPLVNSVCQGLREDFWPSVNIDPDAPDTFDFSVQQLN